MDTVVYLLSALVGLVAFGAYIIVLMHAFRQSAKLGLLCFFLPPFTLFYYAFARFHHRFKGLILALGITCGVLSITGVCIAHLFADDETEPDPDSLDDW